MVRFVVGAKQTIHLLRPIYRPDRAKQVELALPLQKGWVFLIQVPLEGIVGNVFSHPCQFGIVANDAFVIISLPNRFAGGGPVLVDLPGRYRFEILDNRRQ